LILVVSLLALNLVVTRGSKFGWTSMIT
jgi:hypothetical protein